jgi:hypothetical protein
MLKIYALINPSGDIVDIISYHKDVIPPNPNPNPQYANCIAVPCNNTIGPSRDGFRYVNGEFIAPPLPETILPPLPPTPVATISDLQAQMNAIQTQLNILLSAATPDPVVEPITDSSVVPQ